MVTSKIDYSAWRFWFDVAQYIIIVATGLYVWTSSRFNASTKDIRSVEKTIGGIETRVTRLETSAITYKDLGPVYDRINDIAVEVAKIEAVKGTVDMIQAWLMDNGGKK